MSATVEIEAGICGFTAAGRAVCDDGQHVTFELASECENTQRVIKRLAEHGPIDAFAELGAGMDGVIISSGRKEFTGCCAACAVPIGIFKAMQLAAGLALPRDVHIRLERES